MVQIDRLPDEHRPIRSLLTPQEHRMALLMPALSGAPHTTISEPPDSKYANNQAVTRRHLVPIIYYCVRL